MAKAIDGVKVCSTCREAKALDDFHKNRSRPDGRHTDCKECVRAWNRAWREANPEKKKDQRSRYNHAGYDRKHDLKRKYGITVAEYEEMRIAQGGVCAICGGSGSTRNLAVDHDHATGRVRGLLCSPCNLGLGNFRDSTSFLARAIQYLSE